MKGLKMIRILVLLLMGGLWTASVAEEEEYYIIGSHLDRLFGKHDEFSTAKDMVESGLFEKVYRFALEGPQDINTFNIYYAVGVKFDGRKPQCKVFGRYVSGRELIKCFSYPLDEFDSLDVIRAIEHSEIFNLPIKQDAHFLSLGRLFFSAERISSDEHKYILRGAVESLPAKYLMEYMKGLIQQQENDSEKCCNEGIECVDEVRQE